MARCLWLLILAVGICNALDAQNVAIKNNLLYDAALTPNLGVEFRVAPRWTVGANVGLNAWDVNTAKNRKWRHVMASPYARWWVSDSTFHRHFVGVHAVYSHYNVGNVHLPFGIYKSLRNERRQGDLAAIGLSYGYNWRLSNHWHMEAEVGAAVGYTQFDRFACAHCGAKLSSEHKVFLLPKLGLNIAYYLGRRKEAPQPEPEILLPEKVDTAAAVVEPEPVPEPTPEPVVEPQPKSLAEQLQAEYPVVEHVSNYRPYDRTRVLRKEPGALYVNFPFDSDELQPGYRQNAQTLERILHITRLIMSDQLSEIKTIQIVGLSSIDGSVQHNEKLALGRALALKQYIQQHVDVPDSLFEVNGGGEAWAELRDQLADEQMTAPIEVIDNEADHQRRESKLRRIDSGRTYQYIRTKLLPDQRNAGYLRIYYDNVNEKK